MSLAIPQPVRRWVRKVARRVHPPAYILGRVACLGQDVFNAMDARGGIRPRHHALLNMQKVRCDLINEFAHAPDCRAIRTRAAQVIAHLARKDVTWLIQQQERMIWFEHRAPVACAVIDTFAELTDQRFTHRREGWSFCCHYTDLNHTPEFESAFNCDGLLPLARIAPAYERFLDTFSQRYPGTPLYIIEFSAALDDRPQFRARAAAILQSLTTLAKTHSFLHLISLPESQIAKAPGDDFAYHFSKETVQRLAAAWRAQLAMTHDPLPTYRGAFNAAH